MDSAGKEEALSLDVVLENPYRTTPPPEGPHAPAGDASTQTSIVMGSLQIGPGKLRTFLSSATCCQASYPFLTSAH